VTEEALQARVAWLYYMEGLTQAEIAGRLGLTRLRINRLLGDARDSGLVRVTLNSRFAGCVELEARLRTELGLRDAVIVPTPEDLDQVALQIGRATADFISRLLMERAVHRIGVGWGATLREAVRHVQPAAYPSLSVHSMMGGLTHGLEINTFEIAAALARRLDAQCKYLAAPLYAGSAASRDTILQQDVFRDIFEAIADVDVALMGVGDLSRRSLLIRYGLPSDVTAQDLRALGAVGDLLGTFLNADGTPADHDLNRRVIAPSIEVLRKIPTMIVASGGRNKVHVLAAVLRARLASVLICDEQTAAAALALVREAS
jgi:DNA-binding transcriptional regulator LsrR (DeoR family)